ncbi:hypothetical protein LJC62_04770, partial [Odoribacter sp. OttesenSCG-928-A06]|nr:hypothetical protein [Odoribacter sp. OttesenSCG-928-A06]
SDSLSIANKKQDAELSSLFTDLNEISAGMQSLREAENLLSLEAAKEKKASGTKAQQQMAQLKSDVKAISAAISMYKEKINNLEGKNRRQSAEFKKLIAGLNAELEARQQKIDEISKQLEETNAQLAAKTQEAAELTQNVANLTKEGSEQKQTIAEQDKELHTVYYLVGARKALKAANVISRQGIFCPPSVSSEAQKAAFTSGDMREVKSIALNSKSAKVLSTHPENSYSLDKDAEGMLTLNIKDAESFWKQEKYLVVMN